MLQIYHGEYSYNGRGLPAYGASGLAVSVDDGATFRKLGEILSPHLSRDDFLKTNPKGGMWADAAMVDADAQGRHVDQDPSLSGTPTQPAFFYFVFTDRNNIEDIGNCIALARVAKDALIEAIRRGKAPAVDKYYNPAGDVSPNHGFFTEPGIGGRSTPTIVPAKFEFMSSPFVAYDSFIKKFVLY